MPALRVEQLRNQALAGKRGLEAVSFSIAPGECVCLTGPSGCGKTLLLRALADLDISSGLVYLGDRERGTYPGPQWRRRVAYLASESMWWSSAVIDHFFKRRISWLRQLGLSPSILSQSVDRLSSGERQRLALVRLLDREPRVLLLDEPTAALDARSALRVERLIQDQCRRQKRAVLWISHDASQVKRIGDRHFRIRGRQLIGSEQP